MSPARLDHSRSRARASYLAALPSTRSLPGFACSGPCRGASCAPFTVDRMKPTGSGV